MSFHLEGLKGDPVQSVVSFRGAQRGPCTKCRFIKRGSRGLLTKCGFI